MATITPFAASANAAVTFAAASGGGDTIAVGSAQRCTFIVRNASGSSITATLAAVNACSQGVLHNVVVTCAIGDTDILIPASCITSTGTCGVTYSAVTSITVAAVTT
jgi:hypothetical protein